MENQLLSSLCLYFSQEAFLPNLLSLKPPTNPKIAPGIPMMANPIVPIIPEKPILIFVSLDFNCICAASVSYLFDSSTSW